MRRLLSTIAGLSLLTACSGGGDGTTTPSGNPAITLSASATSGTIARNASSTTSITLSRVDGYAGAVSLIADAVPNGVAVVFAPQTLTGTTLSSVVTISVGSTAPVGTSAIVIRATGTGVTEKSVQYALTIPTPTISLAVGSATVSAIQGTSATVPITITRTNGATAGVTLTAEGLPTNVTAGFTPSPIPSTETTSTMNLVVGAGAAAGTSTITVRASGTGLTDQTATFQLTVTAAAIPSYSITAAPAALAIVAGQSGQSVLTIAKSGGFAGNVSLALEGAPTGVTGTFTPNPATGTTSTLTLATTGATTPGTYNVTVRGTAAGLTDRTIVVALTVNQAPGVTVAATPTTLGIAQGASGQSAITLTRLGGLTGDVQLSATGAPAGMTVTFAPAAVSGTASTMTVAVGASVTTGAYPITVTATGAGSVNATAQVTVTVTAPSGFALAATSVSAAQNSTGASTITITRTGGFAAAVDLLVSGLPANVTATFNPASTTGTTSALTFTVGGSATPGAYTITVNGTGAGAANQATTLTLTVTAGAGSGSIAWRFCDPARIPLWFAYRDGSAGAWTRVTPSGDNTFSFSLTGTIGSVAYVMNNTNGGTDGTVFMNTVAEFAGIALSECTANPGTKTVNGSVTGLAILQTGYAYMGGSTATAVFPSTALTFTAVPMRTTDLMAYRSTINTMTGSSTPDRAVLRRDVNYAAAGTAPVIDFNGAESFAVGSATVTVGNIGGDFSSTITQFRTANGAVGSVLPGIVPISGGTVTTYGVPSSKTQAGDFHMFLSTGSTANGSSVRTVVQYNRDLADRTLTLGGVLNVPTITTTATSPYARLKVRGSWQAEYGEAAGTTMYQTTGTQRSWTLSGSRGYFGGGSSEFEFELLDFSGVAGFQNAWGLTAGTATQVNTNALSTISGTPGVISEGSSFKTAARTQSVTP